MIRGIGVDSVDIDRFLLWRDFSFKKLLRIFSEEEILYCLAVPFKSAERFAVRFAAREALFKALCNAGYAGIPFLTLCKQVVIMRNDNGLPALHVQGDFLEQGDSFLVTFTHTRTVATAMVVIQGMG